MKSYTSVDRNCRHGRWSIDPEFHQFQSIFRDRHCCVLCPILYWNLNSFLRQRGSSVYAMHRLSWPLPIRRWKQSYFIIGKLISIQNRNSPLGSRRPFVLWGNFAEHWWRRERPAMSMHSTRSSYFLADAWHFVRCPNDGILRRWNKTIFILAILWRLCRLNTYG